MPSRGEVISIKGADGEFGGYICVPAVPQRVGIVVLQEIFGVNANIRAIVDGFAAAGFAACAPELFWRQERGVELDPSSEEGRARAMKLMGELKMPEAVRDGTAAAEALRARVPGLSRLVAVGYCLGGAVAYAMTTRGVVDAGVSYYGTQLHAMLPQLAGIRGKLLIHIAGDDHLCPPEAQAAIQAEVAKVADHVTVVVHPGTAHAFARVGGVHFDAAAAARANAMTMDFIHTVETGK